MICIYQGIKAEQENSLDIKWQDDIPKNPLSIMDNAKEKEENSLGIKWQNYILEFPVVSIKDNVREEKENYLVIKCQNYILKDPLRTKAIVNEGRRRTSWKSTGRIPCTRMHSVSKVNI